MLQSRILFADTAGPGASLIPAPGESGETFQFGVAYSDFNMPSGIDLTTIGTDDIFVTGPGFNDSNNRPTSFTVDYITTRFDELTANVIYTFTRPGGFGTNVYDVFLNAGTVKDVAGNNVVASFGIATEAFRIGFFETGTPRLSVTPTTSNAALQQALLGSNPGFNVTSFSAGVLTDLGGTRLSAGTYQNRGGIYGLPTGGGIVLTTGDAAATVSGPDKTFDDTIFADDTPEQEALLDSITPSDYEDVTEVDLTFDAPAGGQSVFFNLVFGSEQFDFEPNVDTLGVFVNGVNIAQAGGQPLNSANLQLTGIEGTELTNVVAPGGNPVLTFEAGSLQPTGNTLKILIGDGGGQPSGAAAVYISSLSATAPTPPVQTIDNIQTNIDVIAVAPEGVKLLAAGSDANGQPALQRFNADGTLDATFGNAGTAPGLGVGAGAIQSVRVVANSIYVTGGAGGDRDVFVARYTQDGQLDTSFGDGADGIFSRDFGSAMDIAYALDVDPQGRAVVAGSTDVVSGGTDFLVARLLADGSALDPSFSTDGFAISEFDPGDVNRAGAIATSSDSIVVAGQTGALVAVAKFNAADGSLNLDFDSDGKRILNELKTGDPNVGLALQGDRVLVAASDAAAVNGALNDSNFITARLTAAGNLDTTFGDRGVAKTDMGHTEDADAIVVTGGAIFVLGTRTNNIAGNADTFLVNTAIAQYTADGQAVASFGTDGFTFLDPVSLTRADAQGTVSGQAIGNPLRQVLVANGAVFGQGLAVSKPNLSGGGSNIVVVNNPGDQPEPAAPPTATLAATSPLTAVRSQYTFSVVYADSNGVDVSDLDVNDLLVSNGSATLTVTGVTADASSDGSPRTATYTVAPADGSSFDAADNGTYTVTLRAGEVTDTAELGVAEQALGAITVVVPAQESRGTIGKKRTTIDGVSFSLSNGSAEIFTGSDGRTSVVITGANNATLTVKGAVTLGDVTVGGTLRTVNATAATLAGVMSVPAGSLAKASFANITGGTLAVAGDIVSLAVSGSVSASSQILAGVVLGPDLALGGGNDTYADAEIRKIAVKGSVAASTFAAGANPGPGASPAFGDMDDTASGPRSAIRALAVKGGVDASTIFVARTFPKSARIPAKVVPLDDVRFRPLP